MQAYPHWVRDFSNLAIISVTDAEEQSSPSVQATFVSAFKALIGKTPFFVYGAWGADDFGCHGEGWSYAGSPYESFLAVAMGGGHFPLCDPQFGNLLTVIGHDIAEKVITYKIFLESRPVMASLKVIYADRELPPGPKSEGGYWVYDYAMNAVVFHDLNFASSDVESIRLIYTADGGL